MVAQRKRGLVEPRARTRLTLQPTKLEQLLGLEAHQRHVDAASLVGRAIEDSTRGKLCGYFTSHLRYGRLRQAVQEAFHSGLHEKLAGVLRQYDGERGTVSAHVNASLSHWVIDIIRRQKTADRRTVHFSQAPARETSIEKLLEATSRPMGEEESRQELFNMASDAITTMGEAHRQVLTMHFLQGLRQQEIARLTGVPYATIRTRLRTALSLLRGKLARHPAIEEHLTREQLKFMREKSFAKR